MSSRNIIDHATTPSIQRRSMPCGRKKRAAEALCYNGLVQSRSEIARLARGAATTTGMA
ncbi:hypothetical protein SAMN05519104_6206 [Rhizobiales bacterium GAS188]|nr:hypothetical protein SAMN05519104_6206 [Rhizobiales bacterium GAS188]